MLEIAGGIVLAFILIVTIDIWLPLLGYLVGIVLLLVVMFIIYIAVESSSTEPPISPERPEPQAIPSQYLNRDTSTQNSAVDTGELASEAAKPGAGIGTGTGAWEQAELTEGYMRELTKDQCMLKTINSLKTCETKYCMNAMADVVGDCVTWAKGDLHEFCEEYRERYMVSYCLSRELSRTGCAVVHTGKSVLCETG